MTNLTGNAPNDERAQLYRAVESKWGRSAMFAVAIEELSELTTELARVLRGRRAFNSHEIITEIADATIVLDQLMKLIHDYGLDDDLRREIEVKLTRLEKRTKE